MRHPVVIHLTQTLGPPNAGSAYNKVTVPLQRPLEHVRELQLTEYMIAAPGGSNVIWRVSFRNSNLCDAVSTNAGGNGQVISVPTPGGANVHVVYDMPRIISVDGNRGLSSISVEVTDTTGAPVTFDSLTLFLTVICDDPGMQLVHDVQGDRNRLEWWRSQQFSSRFNP